MFTKDEIHYFEEKLIAEKAKIENELEDFKSELDFGSDTDHLEEETDETEEIANYLGVENVLRKRLQAIEKSLEKIQNNSYGKCDKCLNQIEVEILKIEPDTELCKACKLKLRE